MSSDSSSSSGPPDKTLTSSYSDYPHSSSVYNAAFLTVFGLWVASYFIVIPVGLNLVLTSTSIVVLGSYRSLRLLDPEAVPHDEKETLSSSDAMKFPIVASISLYGLYYAFKNFDKETVNMILACYFSLAGVVTLTSTFSPFVSEFIPGTKKQGFKKTFPLIGEIDLTFTRAEQFCLVLSVGFAYAYYVSKHYMLNNVFGISFCVQVKFLLYFIHSLFTDASTIQFHIRGWRKSLSDHTRLVLGCWWRFFSMIYSGCLGYVDAY